MDGDVAPLPALAELAERHGARLMVDEAHGTGAIGPGGRGTVAAAGLEGEVDVVVGTLGKALGGYGAYACTSAQLREFLINRARPFIFSTAPPPPSVGAALAALGLLESRPGVVEHLRRNAAVMRAGARLVRPGRRRLADADHPGHGRRRTPRGRALRAGARRRRLRPGDQAADSSRRHVALAPDGDGEPPRRRASERRPRDRQGRAGPRRRSPPGGPSPSGLEARRGRRLRHRNGHRGGEDGGCRGHRAHSMAEAGRRVSVYKPAVSGLDEAREQGVMPDHEHLRTAAGSRPGRRGDLALPLRPRGLAAPGRRARRHRDRRPSAFCDGLAAARDAGDFLVCEGVGGFLVPLRHRLPGARLRAGRRAASRRCRSAGPRNDQPHAAHSRGRQGRRARGRGRRPDAVAVGTRTLRACRTSRRSRSSGAVRVETLGRMDLADPASWPPLDFRPA